MTHMTVTLHLELPAAADPIEVDHHIAQRLNDLVDDGALLSSFQQSFVTIDGVGHIIGFNKKGRMTLVPLTD